ncbi:hypothetical protein CVT24_001253 [Panaeolus cyanescens]|uniref:Alkaline phytoceramidase n=1 Tax=Panaeolus cyanescens TaxID=181874 RepID=A0A409YFZ8_9AGAR|nr:hypothetical protein CVT24_001253 [Panaeolus cyanescens]
MMNLTAVAPWLVKQGVYGPVTATLDWCELNHQFSPYIAEMANSFSNLFTIGLALIGYRESLKENLPRRYGLGYLGVALVGIGSFFFHATLLFEAQLADELPMIYVGSMSVGLLLDNKPGFSLNNARTIFVILGLLLFNIGFTWSYIVNRNPVYHQVVFALIILATAVRVTYILRYCPWTAPNIPAKTKATIGGIFSSGIGLFAFGFAIWNVDNVWCGKLLDWKINVGWPLAFFLEGHSWWHVFTGLGTYYMFIGIQHV